MRLETKSYINNEIDLLYFILTRSTERKRRRQIIGYDLCSSEFDKDTEHLNCSRKKFRLRRDTLLKRKLIQINHKNKKSTYYTITPLGICYLSQYRELNTRNVLIAIKIIERFYEMTKQHNPEYVKLKDIREKLAKGFENNLEIVQENFLNITKNQTIVEVDQNDLFQYHIYLSTQIPDSNIKWTMGEFLIMRDGPELEKMKIQIEKIKKNRIKKSSIYTGTYNPVSDIFINYLFFDYPKDINDFVQLASNDILNFRISDFVLKGLLHGLCHLPESDYWDYLNKELKKTGMLSEDKLKALNEKEEQKYSPLDNSFLRIAKLHTELLKGWLKNAQYGIEQNQYRLDDAIEYKKTGRKMYLPFLIKTSKGLKKTKKLIEKEEKKISRKFPEPDFDYAMIMNFDNDERKMGAVDEGWF